MAGRNTKSTTLIAALLWACWCGAAAPASAPAAPERATIPTGNALAAARAQLEEIRNSARPLDPTALLRLADETQSTSPLRYIATLRAMELAARARDIPAALAARQRLLDWYEQEPFTVEAQLVDCLATSQAYSPAATLGVRFTRSALAKGQLAPATRFAKRLAELDASLTPELQQLVHETIRDQQRGHRLSSDSPALFACLYRDQWDTNLKALSETKGELADLARHDLAAADVASRMAAANVWWTAGRSTPDTYGWRVARRAIHIYQTTLPQLTGVERELALTRIAEHHRQELADEGYAPGVLREVSRNKVGAVTNHSTADTLELAKDDSSVDVPDSGARVRYSGLILVGMAGRHDFTFIGGSAMKVWIDDAELLDEPAAYQKRSGIKRTLDLSTGLHSFAIELSSNSSRPRLSVTWTTPSTPEKHPIPAAALVHDLLLAPSR